MINGDVIVIDVQLMINDNGVGIDVTLEEEQDENTIEVDK